MQSLVVIFSICVILFRTYICCTLVNGDISSYFSSLLASMDYLDSIKKPIANFGLEKFQVEPSEKKLYTKNTQAKYNLSGRLPLQFLNEHLNDFSLKKDLPSKTELNIKKIDINQDNYGLGSLGIDRFTSGLRDTIPEEQLDNGLRSSEKKSKSLSEVQNTITNYNTKSGLEYKLFHLDNNEKHKIYSSIIPNGTKIKNVNASDPLRLKINPIVINLKKDSPKLKEYSNEIEKGLSYAMKKFLEDYGVKPSCDRNGQRSINISSIDILKSPSLMHSIEGVKLMNNLGASIIKSIPSISDIINNKSKNELTHLFNSYNASELLKKYENSQIK